MAEDLVEGKTRILLNFAREFWIRKQEDNLGHLASKWGFSSGGGSFSVNVDELVRSGHLSRRFNRNGKAYLKLTLKGEVSVMPFLLPELLILFTLVIALSLFSESLLALMGRSPSFPSMIMAISIVLIGFSLAGLILYNRMERFLLKLPKR